MRVVCGCSHIQVRLRRFVTFDGFAKACAKAAGKPEPEIVHFNPKEHDLGGSKAYPMRDQHFFTSIHKVPK